MISALDAHVDQLEVVLGDVVECYDLVAVALLRFTFINSPLRERRIVNNVRVDVQPLGLRLQICLVHAKLTFLTVWGDDFAHAANFAYVDKLFLIRTGLIFLRIKQDIAVLAEALSLEIVSVHFIYK